VSRTQRSIVVLVLNLGLVSAPSRVPAQELVSVVEAADYPAELAVAASVDGEVAAGDATARHLRRRLILSLVFSSLGRRVHRALGVSRFSSGSRC
jgi:hypothetical protein